MALVNVNGRRRRFERIAYVREIRPGRYMVRSTAGTFRIEGGIHAGGSRTDWFLDGFGNKTIKCKSLMDALRCIETS